MKILITGGRGMLGRTLQQELIEHELVIADLPETDITHPADFDRLMAAAAPDAVIHCAAMTAVDRCETESDLAYRINAFGSANVAAACFRHRARLIAISTDYVFDGELDRPYHEFDTAGHAHTVYGKTKFAGEELIRHHCPDHVICRLAWLYGPGGPSFVHTILKLAKNTDGPLKVVNDQHGNPTSTWAVARQLKNILKRPELVGTFHLTCEGEATWYELAEAVLATAGITRTLQPCTTAAFPRPAQRPANSRLEKRMLRIVGLPPMPDWREALQEFMKMEWPR